MKKTLTSFLSLIMAIACVFSLVVVAFPSAEAATPGVISKVSNVSSGIKVTWEKDSTKSGYYVYRKAGTSSTWSKVATISSPSTTSWTDQSTTNGKKYTYKVTSYKGAKEYTNTTTKVTYRVKTPTVVAADSRAAASFYIESNSNDSADGYQIAYATSSDFSGQKTVTVSGTNVLQKMVSGLSSGKTYYVKFRAYKLVNGTKYYSGYTSVKKITTLKTYSAYTVNPGTPIYTSTSLDSISSSLPYMTKVTMYGPWKTTSKGTWYKIKYDSKVYYLWEDAGQSVFTKNKVNFSYYSSNPYRQAVIGQALYVLNNWSTKYVHDQSDGVKDPVDGKYGFDCSGFVAFVMNSVMQQYVPCYHLSKGIQEQYETEILYNAGFSNPFKTVTICSGTLDLGLLKPGDVLFFKVDTEVDTKGLPYNHCGIYLGNGDFIHSTTVTDGVCIMPLSDYFTSNFVKALRYFPTSAPVPAGDAVYTDVTTSVYQSTSSTSALLAKLYPETPVTVQYSSTTGNWAYVKYDGDKTGYILVDRLTKEAPKTLGYTRYIVNNGQKLYVEPTTEGKYITLGAETKVTYDGRLGSSNFYKIRYDGKQYYLYLSSGSIGDKLTKTAPTKLNETRYIVKQGQKLYTKVSTESSYITLDAETAVVYDGRYGTTNYYKVRYNDKQYYLCYSSGTIDERLTLTAPKNLNYTRYTVVNNQKLYAEPSTESAYITLEEGTKLIYDGRFSTSNYYKVKYEGKRFYIYVKSGSISDRLTKTAPVVIDEMRYVLVRQLKLYTSKSTSGEYITLSAETAVNYCGQCGTGNYFLVKYNGKEYYVYDSTGTIDEKLTLTAPVDRGLTRYIVKSDQKLYTAADKSSEYITLDADTKVIYDGQYGSTNYYKVSYGGVRYYIYDDTNTIGEKLAKSASVPLSEPRTVTRVSLKLYTEPSTDSSYITVYAPAEVVYNGRRGTSNYYKVSYEGSQYYIYDNTETIDQKITADRSGFLNGGTSRTLAERGKVYSLPSTDSEAMCTLPEGTAIHILSVSSSESWGFARTDDGMFGFVLMKKLA